MLCCVIIPFHLVLLLGGAFLIMYRPLLLQSHVLRGSTSWEGRRVFDAVQEGVNLREDHWQRIRVGRRIFGDRSAWSGAPVSFGTSAPAFPPVSNQLHLGSGSQSRLRSAQCMGDRFVDTGIYCPTKGTKSGCFFFSFCHSFIFLTVKICTIWWNMRQLKISDGHCTYCLVFKCIVSQYGDWGPFVSESLGDWLQVQPAWPSSGSFGIRFRNLPFL